MEFDTNNDTSFIAKMVKYDIHIHIDELDFWYIQFLLCTLMSND